MNRNFMELLRAQWGREKFVCVGLDPVVSRIPESAQMSDSSRKDRGIDPAGSIYDFNRMIIDATKSIAGCYKPNIAFYEAYGGEGLEALRDTIRYVHDQAPEIPVILDAKRADVIHVNELYVEMAFNYLNADAITVNPYLGSEALKPFLDCKDKGIIVLCSNKGAGDIQDFCADFRDDRVPLYQYIALLVVSDWNENQNCLLVVGADQPEHLMHVRGIVRDMPILIPGIGAQGGDLKKAVTLGMDSHRQGIIINASRSIIYASQGSDFGKAAYNETLKLHNLINQHRKEN